LTGDRIATVPRAAASGRHRWPARSLPLAAPKVKMNSTTALTRRDAVDLRLPDAPAAIVKAARRVRLAFIPSLNERVGARKGRGRRACSEGR
jgi:hypothetical protein